MKKVLFVLALILSLSGTQAFAHCGVCGVGEAKGSGHEDHDHGDHKGSHMDGEKMQEKMDKKAAMLSEKLGLDERQQAQLKTIMEEKAAKKKEMKAENHDAMKTLQDETHAKIEAILNDEQKTKFAEINSMKDEKGSMKNKKMEDGEKGSHKGSKKGS